jgi:hypothetical protein
MAVRDELLAALRSGFHEGDFKSRFLDHLAEAFCAGAFAVFQQPRNAGLSGGCAG